VGGRVWYARGHVSAAQAHVITRSAVRHATVATLAMAVAVLLLLLAR
jgi:hypothetical protein